MSVGAVILVIIQVIVVIVLLCILLWWLFHHFVWRPFLSGLNPPILNLSLCACPTWPLLSTKPSNEAEYKAWVRKWYIYGATWTFFLIWLALFGVGNLGNSASSEGNPNFFVMVALNFLGAIMITPWCVGITDFCTGLYFIISRLLAKPLPNTRKHWEFERFGFLMSLMIVFLLIGLNTSYQWGRDTPLLKTIEVPLARLPLCLDKLRVFLITDVHTGPNVSKDFVIQTTNFANSLQPDLVLHVGDGGDGRPEDIGHSNKPWGDITCPNRYFVTGNHEYMHGNDGSGVPWENFYETQVGFKVLHNTAVRMGAAEFPQRSCSANEHITLVGIPDVSSDDADLTKATSAVSAGEEWILLSHQPRAFPEAAQQLGDKYVGLQVSGHIHAGQCFPLHPIIYITSGGLFSGLIQRDKSFLFVSNGNSNWGSRVRLFSSPHATLLILRHAQTFADEGKTADLTFTKEVHWAIAGFIFFPLWLSGLLVVYIMERRGSAWWKVHPAEVAGITDPSSEKDSDL